MVLNGEEVVSGGMGHKGEITGGDPNAIRLVTGVGVERDYTGVT